MTDDRPVARTIAGFCQAYGISRPQVYRLLSRGELEAAKAGKRTLILEESAVKWLEKLPRGTKY